MTDIFGVPPRLMQSYALRMQVKSEVVVETNGLPGTWYHKLN
jgi:hypothetical protein